MDEFGDTDHTEDFFEMIGETGNADLLIFFSGLSKNLYKNGDTAAINVRILLNSDKNFPGRTIRIHALVGIINVGFGMGGNVAQDVQKDNIVLAIKLDFVLLLHGQLVPSVAVSVFELRRKGVRSSS
jgi:nicotinic acid phosphoribosyltransferase